MLRADKIRIYPTKAQAEKLDRSFDACRFVYNKALELKQLVYQMTGKSPDAYTLISQMPEAKEEQTWLKVAGAQSLNCEILLVDVSYANFFKGNANFPKFKSKFSKQRMVCPQYNTVDFDNGKIMFTNFREGVRARFSRRTNGKVKSITISRTPTGKYFASVLFDTGVIAPKKLPVTPEKTLGIDVGLIDSATTSAGEKIANPRLLNNSLARLKVLQRRASRKQKGSANREKANQRLRLLHEKIANQRQDFLHKISSRFVSDNQAIATEDLNVSGMMKNGRMARSIADVGWSTLFDFLEYKCQWQGKTFLKIGRFVPSSKTCSGCGFVRSALRLDQRSWRCIVCGATHDRDVNAAINIKNIALQQYSGRGTPGGPVELRTKVRTKKQECELIGL